eukprot:CAMPEP_0172456998 /NCGR_PEP_ID=MMETSP1065-20121228/19198_1 /TAXON_ID=265537 /ORGANISM="Amphiprora paludosa, Strain CCMP125" /LENGTH=92 /DNA_ID=CAMNT_0013210401 /DNA_START=87 /DNA_END=365 /DNA_ORIENTATION=-
MDSIVIPAELQIPLVVVVGLVGFLMVLYLSSISVQQGKGVPEAAATSETTTPVPGTPTKAGKDGKLGSPLGTLQTPAGRRSARLNRKTRKED